MVRFLVDSVQILGYVYESNEVIDSKGWNIFAFAAIAHSACP